MLVFTGTQTNIAFFAFGLITFLMILFVSASVAWHTLESDGDLELTWGWTMAGARLMTHLTTGFLFIPFLRSFASLVRCGGDQVECFTGAHLAVALPVACLVLAFIAASLVVTLTVYPNTTACGDPTARSSGRADAAYLLSVAILTLMFTLLDGGRGTSTWVLVAACAVCSFATFFMFVRLMTYLNWKWLLLRTAYAAAFAWVSLGAVINTAVSTADGDGVGIMVLVSLPVCSALTVLAMSLRRSGLLALTLSLYPNPNPNPNPNANPCPKVRPAGRQALLDCRRLRTEGPVPVRRAAGAAVRQRRLWGRWGGRRRLAAGGARGRPPVRCARQA